MGDTDRTHRLANAQLADDVRKVAAALGIQLSDPDDFGAQSERQLFRLILERLEKMVKFTSLNKRGQYCKYVACQVKRALAECDVIADRRLREHREGDKSIGLSTDGRQRRGDRGTWL